MNKTERYYKIIGLSKTDKPTKDNIKKAYKKSALKWHPDRNRNKKKAAEEKFKEINEAYEILSNPEKKDLYDKYGEDVAQGKTGGPTTFDPSVFSKM